MKRFALLILPAVLSACAPSVVEKKKRFLQRFPSCRPLKNIQKKRRLLI